MNFNFFKNRKDKNIKPTTRVYRKQTIEGVSIPAIIHNSSYYFTDLDVYEDGRSKYFKIINIELRKIVLL